MNDLTHSAQSTLTNKSRLKLLHRREEHLQDLFSTTRSSITTLATEQGRYVQFQEGVILQAFLQIMEPSVTVLARKSDLAVATQASEAAAKSFKEISGRNIAFEVDASLSDDGQVTCFYSVIAFSNQMGSLFSAGGVKLISGSRRITLDNTLDERLKLLEDRVWPSFEQLSPGPNHFTPVCRCCPRSERTSSVLMKIASFIHEIARPACNSSHFNHSTF